jgi:hypothetical protein
MLYQKADLFWQVSKPPLWSALLESGALIKRLSGLSSYDSGKLFISESLKRNLQNIA